MTWQLEPLGFIHTPFTEKFGIPRQGIALHDVPGKIILCEPYDDLNAFRGIEAHSHLWLSFLFHANAQATKRFHPTVRPPRLGGNEKCGVFATRSSFRPNNLGMSVVRRGPLTRHNGQTILTVYGVDMLNQTPIVDIKPYLPYADNIQAHTSLAPEAPRAELQVKYVTHVQQQLTLLVKAYPDLIKILETVLSHDPRPAFHSDAQYILAHPNKTYHVALYDLDIHFSVNQDTALVLDIKSQ